ncbi:MAG: glycosyltransferase family 2 protein [Flavobacteriales bacterium]|jgi:dolichol-phosphate mannosyltransferase|nr:glycosyltransferase family 2 protein [Flavobacteriales bacterium]
MPKISIVIPCYFNEGNIPVTTAALLENERDFSSDVEFEYVFVDDGSEDGTLSELIDFHRLNPSKTKVIALAANVGSYNAIFAGFEYVTGNCVVVMSADLQDPPILIQQMFQKWKHGNTVVLAVRERRNDPVSTKLFASIFNLILRVFGLGNLPHGGFDFCLFDQSLISELKTRMRSGINGLLLLLLIEKKPTTLLYEKRKRELGASQWTFRKKLTLAVNTLLYFLAAKRKPSGELYQIRETYGVE